MEKYIPRVVARAIILNKEKNKVLLVKNKGTDFWYPPGGGWECDNETIEQCVVREAREEVGMDVQPVKLIYVQEFRNEKAKKAIIELFWVCEIVSFNENKNHVDLDPNGAVETFKWFSRDEMNLVTVFPEVMKDGFWNALSGILSAPDVFLK